MTNGEVVIRGGIERVQRTAIPKEWEETHQLQWQHRDRSYDATVRCFKTRPTQQYPESTTWLSVAYRNQYVQVRATEDNVRALVEWLNAILHSHLTVE